jgi:uncharacterized protein (DUF2384 family)
MNQQTTTAKPMPQDDKVLLKAIRRVQSALSISPGQLLSILKTKSLEGLNASSETGRRAAMLIWIYQRLYAYIGDDKKTLCHWVNTHNKSLGSSPIDVMSADSGLNQVIEYLNSRGA